MIILEILLGVALYLTAGLTLLSAIALYYGDGCGVADDEDRRAVLFLILIWPASLWSLAAILLEKLHVRIRSPRRGK